METLCSYFLLCFGFRKGHSFRISGSFPAPRRIPIVSPASVSTTNLPTAGPVSKGAQNDPGLETLIEYVKIVPLYFEYTNYYLAKYSH